MKKCGIEIKLRELKYYFGNSNITSVDRTVIKAYNIFRKSN